MAGIDRKLTDLTELASPTDNAWIHVVEPTDISQSPEGSSFKVKKSNFGGLSDAPSDGETYGRKDGAWEIVGGGDVLTTNTNITSSSLTTQDVAGFVSYINGLVSSFPVSANEIRTYTVTDTGQKFQLLLRGRSFGGSEPDITSNDVLEISGAFVLGNIYRKRLAIFASPTIGGAVSNIGMNLAETPAGTNVSVNSSIFRQISTTAVAGQTGELREGSFTRIAANQKFLFSSKIRNSDAVVSNSERYFYGLTSTLSTFGNIDISAIAASTAIIGIGCDSSDTNVHLFVRESSGSLNKIDLSYSKLNIDEFELIFYMHPYTANLLCYSVKNITLNITRTGTLSYNNSTALNARYHKNNGTDANSVIFGLNYLEIYVQN